MTSNVMTLVEKKFVFRNTSDELYHLINEILSFIKSNIQAEEYGEISGRCKLVLIELFTNALKHSDANETVLTLQITEDAILLNKADTGKPFSLPESQHSQAIKVPVAGAMVGEKIIVYRDDMASLYCKIENPEELSFVVKDYDVEVPPIPTNLLEHFGLMIIAKAADSFSFKYNPQAQTNNFVATLRY
ncbi:MAG: hypothetical protein K0S09_2484 [Sphingobacteriaceae bacterium]|nr:hypothetical protein [Sphingobacteriaceae bacterium]